jgi:predicted dehydrogenase
VSGHPARIALVGANGFGVIHRRNLARLEGLGRATLVAVAEPAPVSGEPLPEHVRLYSDLEALLAGEDRLDVVIVSTPLHTHFDLAERVLASGADLYLEKPPVTSLEQLGRLRESAAAAGRLVQVGFQSLGSHAVPWLRSAIAEGTLGEVRAITATGSWTRPVSYFTRSPWAGRRTLDGVDVVDGVATNALSHAVITALHVAGVRRADGIEAVESDLFRANDAETDDTSVVRVRRPAGEPDVTCALTLCGPEEAEPFVTVHGSAATATFFYVIDQVRVEGADGARTDRYGRTDLLENLLDARDGHAELLSALDDTEAYLTVLEAVRTGPEARRIPAAFVDRVGSGPEERLVVRRIVHDLARATSAEATFTELGLPWAAGGTPPGGEEVAVAGRVVAVNRRGERLAASLSPRPYLHPVRTLGGVALTDHLPLDHSWHLGVGVAMPDVAPAGAERTNLWGGPDYRAEAGGYRWARTHGTMRVDAAETLPDGMLQRLVWSDPRGAGLLRERREWRWDAVDDATWRLRLRFELHADEHPVTLSSPGSHGRAGAGYGGFFWRFAPCDRIAVRSADRLGEEQANGAASPWLLWTAVFDGRPASVLFGAPPEAEDPWFVRASEYPGVGSALAWSSPLVVAPDAPVVRTLTVHVSDGTLTAADAERLVGGGPATPPR